MGKIINLEGQRFGMLRVVSLHGLNKRSQARWVCLCDCGNNTIVLSGSLRSGHTSSCGCARVRSLSNIKTTHGLSKTPLHNIWKSIKQRCSNKNDRSYKNYGGRGINICKEWDDFNKFHEWSINNGYAHGLEIDRIDNNLGYYPSNCRFVTRQVNQRNKRDNKILTYNGKSLPMISWSEITGIKYDTIKARLRHGWDTEKALSTN